VFAQDTGLDLGQRLARVGAHVSKLGRSIGSYLVAKSAGNRVGRLAVANRLLALAK
jgi:hypothetical protein